MQIKRSIARKHALHFNQPRRHPRAIAAHLGTVRSDCGFDNLPDRCTSVVALFLPLTGDGLFQRLARHPIPTPYVVETNCFTAHTNGRVPLLAGVERRIEVDEIDALGVQPAQDAQVIERVDD